ncbi:MAG: AraC family transcriptional regulator [Melioribacteraceae bacterium]|nr:AraC family transcriptional regulator [Melioribacteraceae bacterium]
MRNFLFLLLILNICLTATQIKQDSLFENIFSIIEQSKKNENCESYNELFNIISNSLILKDTTSTLGAFSRLSYQFYNNEDYSIAKDAYSIISSYHEKQNNIKAANDAYFYLGCIYNELSDFKNALKYHIKSKNISKSFTQHQYVVASYKEIALTYFLMEDYSNARIMLGKAVCLSDSIGYSGMNGAIFNMYGNIFDKEGKFDESIKFYNKALVEYQRTEFASNIAGVYNNIGTVYENMGQLEKAAEYYLNSVEIKEELNQKYSASITYQNLSNVFERIEDFEKAELYADKSLQIAEELNLRITISNSLDTKGRLKFKLGKYEKALEMFDSSLAIKKETQLIESIALTNIMKAKVYRFLGENQKALELLKLAEQNLVNYGSKLNLANCYHELSDLYIKTEEFANALEYSKMAYGISDEIGANLLKSKTAMNLNLLFKKEGNYKKSLEFLEVSQAINDSLFNKETIRSITKSEMQYNFEKEKSLSAKEYNKEKEILIAEIDHQKELRNFFVISFLIAAILMAVLINMFLARRKAYKTLVRKSAELLKKDECKDSEESDVKNKYNNSKLDKEYLRELQSEIHRLVLEDKIYLDPDLTIKSLSEKINTNSTYLSQTINSFYGKNFNTFINEFRIKEAQKLILDDIHESMSIEGIAVSVGFNNRTSFSAAFKNYTGVTPSFYIKSRSEVISN